jgi:hypothetical protein
MQVVTVQKQCHLGKLSDELIAAIPALAPVLVPGSGPDGRDAKEPQFNLEGNQTHVRVRFPDDVSAASVQAVIDAHDSTPPAPHADATIPQAIKDKLSNGDNLTQAEIKKLFRVILRRLSAT